MKSKCILVRGHGLVGQGVAHGDADLGLRQISELRGVPGIWFLGPIPEDAQKIGVISAVVPIWARHREAADKLVAFLLTEPAAQMLARTGRDRIGLRRKPIAGPHAIRNQR